MSRIRAFKALRAHPDLAARVASPPYDVMNRAEAAALAGDNPLSFLRVSRAEITLPQLTDVYSPQVYDRARENLQTLIQQRALVQETEPSLYIYRLTWKGRDQTGVLAAFSIDEYENGLIARHEKTRKEKEDDRTRHVLTTECQTGPVFLAYKDLTQIDQIIDQETSGAPLIEFTAKDQITHRLWRINDTLGMAQAFTQVPKLYIADGHHRAASAARARKELEAGASKPSDFMLAVAFASSQLRILPYHRVIKDLGGRAPQALLAEIAKVATITPAPATPPSTDSIPPKGSMGLYLAGTWHTITPLKRPPAQDVIGSLDVSVLQAQVLSPILGIQDPRTDKRIDFVGGIRGTAELERLVNSGEAACAFSMHATSLEELFAVADAGEIMPPKSTWFEPKLRDGLISHWIRED